MPYFADLFGHDVYATLVETGALEFIHRTDAETDFDGLVVFLRTFGHAVVLRFYTLLRVFSFVIAFKDYYQDIYSGPRLKETGLK